jgi:hypothetical protein
MVAGHRSLYPLPLHPPLTLSRSLSLWLCHGAKCLRNCCFTRCCCCYCCCCCCLGRGAGCAGHEVGNPKRALRTMKYMYGVCCGAWVVSTTWIRECLESGCVCVCVCPHAWCTLPGVRARWGAQMCGPASCTTPYSSLLSRVPFLLPLGQTNTFCVPTSPTAVTTLCPNRARASEEAHEIEDDGCARMGPKLSRFGSLRKVGPLWHDIHSPLPIHSPIRCFPPSHQCRHLAVLWSAHAFTRLSIAPLHPPPTHPIHARVGALLLCFGTHTLTHTPLNRAPNLRAPTPPLPILQALISLFTLHFTTCCVVGSRCGCWRVSTCTWCHPWARASLPSSGCWWASWVPACWSTCPPAQTP